MSEDSGQPAYSVAEAAQLLGVSDDSIRKRLTRGAISGFRRGQHWFVDRAAVEAERGEVLARLAAVDARGASADARESELRAEVSRLRAVIHELMAAQRAQLDALGQLVVQDFPDR